MLEHRWLVRALKPMISRIAQPSVILHPREDDIADMRNAWFLQRTMKGRVDMSVLEDCYHNITLDRQRQIVVERTAEFIRSVTREQNEVVARAELRAKAKAALKGNLAAVA